MNIALYYKIDQPHLHPRHRHRQVHMMMTNSFYRHMNSKVTKEKTMHLTNSC